MPKHGKKYRAAKEMIDSEKKYSIAEGVDLAMKGSYTSFPGTLEIHIKTGANPKYQDQMMRGTVSLPHGTGKTVRVAAFVNDDVAKDATAAGADIAGKEILLADIKNGKFDFDVLVTSPDMMRELAPVAKQLGPKGLMPSPKAGTVTPNIVQAVEEVKKGRLEYKLDKTGNIHLPVGKVNFTAEQLVENITMLLDTLNENRPSGVKGKLIRKISIAPTMGPGIHIAEAVE